MKSLKLSKEQLKVREGLTSKLNSVYDDLNAAVDAFNTAMADQWAKVEEALQAYNESLDETRQFVDDVAGEITDYIDEKSEKWQEGEKGQQANEWRDAWSSDPFEDISLDRPDDLSLDDINEHYTLLDDIPETADSL